MLFTTQLDRSEIQNILYNMDTYRLFFKSMLNIAEEHNNKRNAGCRLPGPRSGLVPGSLNSIVINKEYREC